MWEKTSVTSLTLSKTRPNSSYMSFTQHQIGSLLSDWIEENLCWWWIEPAPSERGESLATQSPTMSRTRQIQPGTFSHPLFPYLERWKYEKI